MLANHAADGAHALSSPCASFGHHRPGLVARSESRRRARCDGGARWNERALTVAHAPSSGTHYALQALAWILHLCVTADERKEHKGWVQGAARPAKPTTETSILQRPSKCDESDDFPSRPSCGPPPSWRRAAPTLILDDGQGRIRQHGSWRFRLIS